MTSTASVTNYARPHTVVERTFDVKGAAPDTDIYQGEPRTIRIRPDTLTLRTRGADLNRARRVVDSVSLNGRFIRKSDGELTSLRRGDSWFAKNHNGKREDPPSWVLEIIEAEGLVYGDA